MVRLVSDENFSGPVVRGLRLRCPNIDLVRIQDVGLSGIKDPDLLEWAAADNRVVLTHDRTTMTKYADDRIRAGLLMPGVFLANDRASIRSLIDALEYIETTGDHAEWANCVTFIP